MSIINRYIYIIIAWMIVDSRTRMGSDKRTSQVECDPTQHESNFRCEWDSYKKGTHVQTIISIRSESALTTRKVIQNEILCHCCRRFGFGCGKSKVFSGAIRNRFLTVRFLLLICVKNRSHWLRQPHQCLRSTIYSN